MGPILLTVIAIAVIMLAMAVGVLLGRRPLRGSCGGAEGIVGPDGEVIVCSNCGCGLADVREEDGAAAEAGLPVGDGA